MTATQIQQVQQTLERWSSRRFWSMMLWQGVNTWLVAEKLIPHEAYVSVTWLLLGGYFLANTSQHVVDKLAEKK